MTGILNVWLVLGELSGGLLPRLVVVSAMVISAGFGAGLFVELMEKCKQGADA